MASITNRSGSYLDPARVVETIQQLSRRIEERFPEANLIQACEELLRLCQKTERRAEWISRPIISLRVAAAGVITLIAAAFVGLARNIEFTSSTIEVAGFVSLMNATMNNVVLIGAVIFFLVTIEARVKRNRALLTIHELRSLAHVIDMHQLTKDPDRLIFSDESTLSSPSNDMNVFEMSRYLDYCAEMLSLVGKVASIYSLHWPDETALRSVNEIERLTAGLSQKIFQKTMILHGTVHVSDKPSSIQTPYNPRDSSLVINEVNN